MREELSALERQVSSLKESLAGAENGSVVAKRIETKISKADKRIEALKAGITGLHKDNISRSEKAERMLEDFCLSRMYVPVDVEHITRKGYVLSQAKLENNLIERYSISFKEAHGDEEQSSSTVLSYAFKCAEESICEKSSAKKEVRKRLAETSRMKSFRKCIKR